MGVVAGCISRKRSHMQALNEKRRFMLFRPLDTQRDTLPRGFIVLNVMFVRSWRRLDCKEKVMPTDKIRNAEQALPPYLLKMVQEKLGGKGMLLYVPALKGWYAPPYRLEKVALFTAEGWSAARIATLLDISTRQVYRLRQIIRDHPERLQATRPKEQKAGPVSARVSHVSKRRAPRQTPKASDESEHARSNPNMVDTGNAQEGQSTFITPRSVPVAYLKPRDW